MTRLLAIVLGSTLFGCAGDRDVGTATEEPTAKNAAPDEVVLRGRESVVHIETPARAGSGFVVRNDGVIVTNYTLVVGQRAARVVLADGRGFIVDRVLASDAKRNLAVLAIAAEQLPALQLSAAGDLAVGDRVFAIGHGLGMITPTLAEGVIGSLPQRGDEGSFQVEAPALAGFGGSPVLDARGRVVGMVSLRDQATAGIAMVDDIAEIVGAIGRSDGETLVDFGERTRRESGWHGFAPMLDATALGNCSTLSQESIWTEVEQALRVAAPVNQLGGHEAAFRVLEGAVLRLSEAIDDCPALVQSLRMAVAAGRDRGNPAEGAETLAAACEAVLELLFAAPTANKVPIATRSGDPVLRGSP